jgi:hypothetical protein
MVLFPAAYSLGEYEEGDKVRAGEHNALEGFRELFSLRRDS